MKRDLLIVLALCIAAGGWLLERSMGPAPGDGTGLNTAGLLNAAPEQFDRVTGPRPLSFPEDHALHPGFRNEWWYFTGNVSDDTGRPFGFQFTLFRFALDPGRRPESDFAADAVWMVHLAISDIAGKRFHSRERFARGALGLAGASADEWWLRDWVVRREGTAWVLAADAEDFALDFELIPVKPIVLQAEGGYSRKGPEPGNASRYYSITRLAARGRIGIGGRVTEVAGTAWLDREWGSSQLGAGLVGWDWFALQFEDGRDLMLYRLRTADGEKSPFSAGMLVAPDGRATVLEADEFELVPMEYWRDAAGIDWPVRWRLRVAASGLELDVQAAFEAQRWDGTVDYWEGAVRVYAAGKGDPVGRGYLELSGYADRTAARGRPATVE